LIKYIKSVLWRVAKRLSYIEDARCLKVKILCLLFCYVKTSCELFQEVLYHYNYLSVYLLVLRLLEGPRTSCNTTACPYDILRVRVKFNKE